MKRNVWIGSVAVIALAFSGGTAAQSSNAQGNRDQSSQNIITVTGCLQQADRMSGTTTAGATSTAGSTSTSSSGSSGSERFILTNASVGSGSSSTTTEPGSTRPNTQSSTASTATSTSGTTGGGSSKSIGSSGSMYTLEGRATELRPHVNHQVQITGRLDSTSGTGSTATTTGKSSTSADTSGTQRSANSGQRLHVESVRMIAATCPSR